MQQITDKNINSYFKGVIDFAERVSGEKSKSLIFRTIGLIAENNKSKLNEHIEFTSTVSNIIINDTGGGINTLVAGMLYVFFDKNEIDIQFIKDEFGISVSKIIEGLYKIPKLKTEKIDKQSDKFIKFLLTVTDDVRAILILLAVELYNVRYIERFEDSIKQKIINQSKTLYTPLAHRIGLYNIKTEFEEKTMKFSEEEMYRFIAKKLQETKASRDNYINDFIEPLNNLLKDSGYSFTIKGRPKSIHSIWNKMKSQNVPFEEVYDLFAIRVILKSDIKNEKAVCWNVYSIITDFYKPNPKRLRDWISAPKLSGYESLHTTVLGADKRWVEVQIRTKRMDEVAEKGPAAHWRYKTGKEGGNNDWLANIREALENPKEYDSESEIDSKTELYSDEILVFTPEGDLKGLKNGYTIIDFAFAVHTKIGETCSGAVVNGKIETLSYVLKNGDTVKILINKNKKPNAEWLDIAKGTRTKNKIKRALKSLTFNRAEIGKEITKEKLERLKIKFSEKNIDILVDFFKFKSPLAFYHSIGEGLTDVSKLKQAFEKTDEVISEPKPKLISKNIENDSLVYDDYLLIDDNISNLDYSLSKCCNPLPGDDIFGFVTVNKGTRIHKRTCPNSKDLKTRYPYRILKAKWNVDKEGASFSGIIQITGNDSPGISSKLTDIISKEFNLRILAISFKALKNNMFEGHVVVQLNNKKQLVDLISRIKMMKNIKSVFHK